MIGALILSLSIFYNILMFSFLNKKNKKIPLDITNVTIIVNIIVYGIVLPLNYFLSINGYNSQLFLEKYNEITASDIVIYYAVAAMSTATFIIILKLGKQIEINEGEAGQKNKTTIVGTQYRKLLFLGLAMLIIGIVSDYIYLKAYGGYSNYLGYSKLLRSGIMIVDNPFSFMMPFRNCTLLSSYIFGLIAKKRKIFPKILLFLSVIFSFRILYSNAGRLSMAIYIILLLVSIFYKEKTRAITIRSVLKIISVLAITALFTILLGVILKRNTDNSILTTLNTEISFPFLNLMVFRGGSDNTDYRLLFDALGFIIYILPSSIWSNKIGINTASSVITAAWFGSAKGFNGITAEMPADFITISYMQLGFMGSFILPAIFALVYKILYKLSNKITENKLKTFTKIYILINIGISSIYYCDPYLIIQKSIPLLVFAALYISYEVIKKGVNKYD